MRTLMRGTWPRIDASIPALSGSGFLMNGWPPSIRGRSAAEEPLPWRNKRIARRPPGARRHIARPASRLVSQASSHLLRCDRLRAPTTLASVEFVPFRFRNPPEVNATSVARWLVTDRLLCRMIRANPFTLKISAAKQIQRSRTALADPHLIRHQHNLTSLAWIPAVEALVAAK